jgi:hypothetical protein
MKKHSFKTEYHALFRCYQKSATALLSRTKYQHQAISAKVVTKTRNVFNAITNTMQQYFLETAPTTAKRYQCFIQIVTSPLAEDFSREAKSVFIHTDWWIA